MDINFLVKLIRLANHNNADGEANTAARRVCKLIEEDAFKCLAGYVDDTKRRPVPPPTPHPPQYDRAWDPLEEIMKEVRRKAEEEANRRAAEQKTKAQEPFKWTRPANPFHEPYYKTTYYDEPKKREPKPKKFIKCTKCGVEKETGFVGPPQVYVCTECQWESERDTTFVQFGDTRELMCSKCRFVIPEVEFYHTYRTRCPNCDRRIL